MRLYKLKLQIEFWNIYLLQIYIRIKKTREDAAKLVIENRTHFHIYIYKDAQQIVNITF